MQNRDFTLFLFTSIVSVKMNVFYVKVSSFVSVPCQKKGFIFKGHFSVLLNFGKIRLMNILGSKNLFYVVQYPKSLKSNLYCFRL